MRYILFLLLPFLLFSEPFKVATYNVENLFDAQYVGTEYDTYTTKHNWTKRMVEIKLNHVAEVICDVDADIIGLQEVENTNIFKQLQQRLEDVGCGYKYAAITSKKDATIQVALLSRFPIKDKRELVVSKSPRVRNILEVKVDVQGEPLWLFVNHWKSRAYHGVESKRMKYAKVLAERLKYFSHSKPYIILGDFNTDYDAHLGLEKKIDDTDGKTGLHTRLHIAKNGYLVREDEMLEKHKGQHYTLWNELALDKRWNTKFYGKKGTADHILLPSSLFDAQGLEYVNDSFCVFKSDYLFTKRGYINRWQYKKGKHRAKGYSDHLPVYAYFDSKPYIKSKNKRADAHRRSEEMIEYFYEIIDLDHDVVLENVVVIWKFRNHAIIKQTKEGRGIFLFGCAGELEQGIRYDLLVRGLKDYNGLKELTHVYVLNEHGKEDISKYLLTQGDILMSIGKRQNEVMTNLVGVYKDRHFYIEGLKIPIYFKSKKYTPPNRAKLKIDLALLGYYKRLQLVIFNKKDFEILEK